MPSLELEKLRAEANRLVTDMAGPLPALELDRLRTEETRIRGEIDRLTDAIESQIDPT